MARSRSWTDDQLRLAVTKCASVRAVIVELRLIPAGGNYLQVTKHIKALGLDTNHSTGKGWNTGMKFRPVPQRPLQEITLSELP